MLVCHVPVLGGGVCAALPGRRGLWVLFCPIGGTVCVLLDASESSGSVDVTTNTKLNALGCYLHVLLAPKPDKLWASSLWDP